MKSFIMFFVIIVSAVTLTAQTYSTYAGAAENRQKYSPIDRSRFKPLSQEEDTLRFTGVFHGLVVGGIKFAWLEDELVVFNKITNRFIRIYDCGNKGEFFSEKKSDERYVPLSMIGKLYGPPGRDGINGRDGVDGKDAFPPIKEASLWKSPWLMGGIAIIALGLLFKLAWPHPSKTPAYIPPTPNLSDGGTLPPN